MVACVSSDGRLWYHWVTGSHDHEGFALFLERIAENLDENDSGWRDRYVMYVDHARIHEKALSSDRVKLLRFPCKFAGKAGFAAVPCENLFWLIRRFEEEARDIEGTVAIP